MPHLGAESENHEKDEIANSEHSEFKLGLEAEWRVCTAASNGKVDRFVELIDWMMMRSGGNDRLVTGEAKQGYVMAEARRVYLSPSSRGSPIPSALKVRNKRSACCFLPRFPMRKAVKKEKGEKGKG